MFGGQKHALFHQEKMVPSVSIVYRDSSPIIPLSFYNSVFWLSQSLQFHYISCYYQTTLYIAIILILEYQRLQSFCQFCFGFGVARVILMEELAFRAMLDEI